jgi:hypothetical protein
MHSQHAGLSQTLAEQHITGLLDEADQARLVRGARSPRRRRRSWMIGGWWQLARRPGIAMEQPVQRPGAQSTNQADPEIRCGRAAETPCIPMSEAWPMIGWGQGGFHDGAGISASEPAGAVKQAHS